MRVQMELRILATFEVTLDAPQQTEQEKLDLLKAAATEHPINFLNNHFPEAELVAVAANKLP